MAVCTPHRGALVLPTPRRRVFLVPVPLRGVLVLPTPLSASVVGCTAYIPAEGRSCDHGHVPRVRRGRCRAIGDLKAPVSAVVQVVGGQLVDREPAAQAATQLQDDLSHHALIDDAFGGLGLLYAPFTVLPEAGEVFKAQGLDSPITTYERSGPIPVSAQRPSTTYERSPDMTMPRWRASRTIVAFWLSACSRARNWRF